MNSHLKNHFSPRNMQIRISILLIIFISIQPTLSQIIQLPVFGSNYTNDITFNYYVLDFTGFSYQNILIVFRMEIVDAIFSSSNYLLDVTINNSIPNYVNISNDQSIIEVGFKTNVTISLLYISNLKNPLYANTYQLNYKVSQFESTSTLRTIKAAASQSILSIGIYFMGCKFFEYLIESIKIPIKKNMLNYFPHQIGWGCLKDFLMINFLGLISLALSATTGNTASALLSIKPIFQLPVGAVLQIQLPSFSSDVPSLNFVENPVICFQGESGNPIQNEVSSLVYLNKTLVIPTYASTVNGAPKTGFVVWLSGFRSPPSTRPHTIPIIQFVGGDNQMGLMQQINYIFQVTTPSDPKSIYLKSSNLKTLSLTTFTIKIQSRTFFNSDTVINIKFPPEFGFSSFSNDLKAFNETGTALTLIANNNNSTITVWNSYKVGSTDLIWMRLEGVVNSVGALTTSTSFEIHVFDDSTMLYKFHEDTSSLYYSTIVNSLEIKAISLSNFTVQLPTRLSLTFNFADGLSDYSLVSTRLTIFLPDELSFGSSILSMMKSQGKIVCSTLTSYFSWTGSSSSSMCELEGVSTIRVYEFYQQGSSTEVTLMLKDIINPLSSTKTKPISIEIDGITSASTNWASLYSSKESSESLEITAIAGSIVVSEFKSLGSSRTFDFGSYRLSFDLTSKIPPSGFIELKFPEEFLFSSMNQSMFSCIFEAGLVISQTSCFFFYSNNTILFSLGPQQMVEANTRVIVILNGIRNPRSIRPTNLISISSYLESRQSPIDEIKESHDPSVLSLTMSSTRDLTILSINPESFFVGEVTSYQVSLFADTPIFGGDILAIDFGEIKIEQDSNSNNSGMKCLGLNQQSVSISCSAVNNTLYLQFHNKIAVSTTFQFQIWSLKNPSSSILISTPLKLDLSDQGIYLISSSSYLSVPKRDSKIGFDAALLDSFEVFPESDFVGADTAYQISFKTPISLLANSYQLNATLSSEVSVPNQDSLGCFVLIKSISPSTNATCVYSKSKNSVLISDFYPSSAKNRFLSTAIDISEGSVLQIRITGLKNKAKSGKFSSNDAAKFNLQILSTSLSDSKITVLAESNIIPSVEFICDSSCSACYGSAIDCTSCESNKILLIDQKRCVTSCGLLYAHVGNSCQQCTVIDRDPNCVACSNSDLSECTKCDINYILSSSLSTSNGICELVSNSVNPEKNFIYDTKWNLPFISLYLIITGIITAARRFYSYKCLNSCVVLLVLWSIIESLVLVVFTIKVMMLPSIESSVMVGGIMFGYLILHGIFSVRVNRNLMQDGGFMLYQPNYDTIKIIQASFRFNNVKSVLSFRSRFSFIRDIYNIPFTNSVQLQVVVRQALIGSLIVSLLLISFNAWIMYFTYTYRLVKLPPFFFIEFEILHLLLAFLIMVLLFSKDKSPYSLVQLFATSIEEITVGSTAGRAIAYKQPQLDITQKSASFITYATKKCNGNEEIPNASGTGIYIRSNEIIPQQNHSVMAGESMIELIKNNPSHLQRTQSHSEHESHQNQLRCLGLTTLTPQTVFSQIPVANKNNMSLTQEGSLLNYSSNQDLRIIPRFSSSQSSISPSSANSGLNTPVKQGISANRFHQLPLFIVGQEPEVFVNRENRIEADSVQFQTAQFDKGSPEKAKKTSSKNHQQQERTKKENSNQVHSFIPFFDGVSQQQNLIISSKSSIRISQQQSCDEGDHQFTIKIEDVQAEVNSSQIHQNKHRQKSVTIEVETSSSSAKKKQSPTKSQEPCSEKYTESTEKDGDEHEQIQEIEASAAAKTTSGASQFNQFLILNSSNPINRSPANTTRLKSSNNNSPPQSQGTPQLGRVNQNSRSKQQQYQEDQTVENTIGIGTKVTDKRKNQPEEEFAKDQQNQESNKKSQERQNNHISVPMPQQLWSFSQNKQAPQSSKHCVSQFDYLGEARQSTDTAVSPHTTIPLHDPSGSLLLPNRTGNIKAPAVPFHES